MKEKNEEKKIIKIDDKKADYTKNKNIQKALDLEAKKIKKKK